MSKKDVTIHVVNSVKGGSGKSSIALLLAGYYSLEPETEAYIIDLDYHGTSWKDTFGKYVKGGLDDHSVYLNDLMYNWPCFTIFHELDLDYLSERKTGTVHICMMDPERNELLDEVKIDLFENAIYKVIREIYRQASEKPEEEPKNLHIILDMPPSYESHAERVLKHLLLDKTSSLVTEAEKCKGVYESFNPYSVHLIMLSAINLAHANLNRRYLFNLFQRQSMSSALNHFCENQRFSVDFWVNDVTAIATELASDPEQQNIEAHDGLLRLHDSFLEEFSGMSHAITEVIRQLIEKKIHIVPWLKFLAAISADVKKDSYDSIKMEENEAYGKMEELT